MSTPPTFTPENIEKVAEKLKDASVALAERFRALFTLKNIGGPLALEALIATLRAADDSALLKHEVAYCLGQMGDKDAVPALYDTLKNRSEDTMVRHEAGEALGAIGSEEALPMLQEFIDDPAPEVAETCVIAVDLIKYRKKCAEKKATVSTFKSGETDYGTVDPAPPCKKEKSVAELRATLLDTSKPLFKRYRALFSLRNAGGEEAVQALVDGFEESSSLFRHEIAYVLGQMQSEHSLAGLTKVLRNDDEHPMVRHEAAEAIGAIASDVSLDLLGEFKEDSADVVRDSCVVALDMHVYYSSDQFQYADSLAGEKKE
eukprot:TRINITY_DN9210_c0_g1_i1.p1 TRINITY_DN9210_c0_g1~~TRINITY_DN9210_c0_g1_i1.p1  ORF type:complete len:317 (+),score=67.60 TRINITY_DN9210_c0_g1_i1:319-1269(+)